MLVAKQRRENDDDVMRGAVSLTITAARVSEPTLLIRPSKNQMLSLYSLGSKVGLCSDFDIRPLHCPSANEDAATYLMLRMPKSPSF